jgi:hypothetical protein
MASPKFPQGHGFMAATNMKLAGNVKVPCALEMVTTLGDGGALKIFTGQDLPSIRSQVLGSATFGL